MCRKQAVGDASGKVRDGDGREVPDDASVAEVQWAEGLSAAEGSGPVGRVPGLAGRALGADQVVDLAGRQVARVGPLSAHEVGRQLAHDAKAGLAAAVEVAQVLAVDLAVASAATRSEPVEATDPRQDLAPYDWRGSRSTMRRRGRLPQRRAPGRVPPPGHEEDAQPHLGVAVVGGVKSPEDELVAAGLDLRDDGVLEVAAEALLAEDGRGVLQHHDLGPVGGAEAPEPLSDEGVGVADVGRPSHRSGLGPRLAGWAAAQDVEAGWRCPLPGVRRRGRSEVRRDGRARRGVELDEVRDLGSLDGPGEGEQAASSEGLRDPHRAARPKPLDALQRRLP